MASWPKLSPRHWSLHSVRPNRCCVHGCVVGVRHYQTGAARQGGSSRYPKVPCDQRLEDHGSRLVRNAIARDPRGSD